MYSSHGTAIAPHLKGEFGGWDSRGGCNEAVKNGALRLVRFSEVNYFRVKCLLMPSALTSGKILANKLLEGEMFFDAMKSARQVQECLDYKAIGNNFFFFQFQRTVDMLRVKHKGPWYVLTDKRGEQELLWVARFYLFMTKLSVPCEARLRRTSLAPIAIPSGYMENVKDVKKEENCTVHFWIMLLLLYLLRKPNPRLCASLKHSNYECRCANSYRPVKHEKRCLFVCL